MTEAVTTSGADASPAAAEGAASAAATEGQTQQQPAAEAQAEGAQEPAQVDPNAPQGEAKAEGDEAPKGAPEAYTDFVLPEGVAIQPETLTELTALAKELNLPQEAAQRLVDLGAKQATTLAEQRQTEVAGFAEGWLEASKTDAEIGGAKLTESLSVAKRGLDAFGSPALRDLLDGSGLGNHPEFIRLFVKVGQAISEDKIDTGHGAGGDRGSAEDRLYPSMRKSA